MRVLISVSTRKYFGKCVYSVIASAVGTTLLHSPGWNEGKARNGTLGTHRQKRIELRRSGTYPLKQMPQRINTLRRKTTNRNDTNQMRAVSAAPLGLNKCVSMINPGRKPWAMQEYRPYRALFNRYMFADAFLCVYSAIASAVGTILLHSPGCNEGKARNETLGTHRQK